MHNSINIDYKNGDAATGKIHSHFISMPLKTNLSIKVAVEWK